MEPGSREEEEGERGNFHANSKWITLRCPRLAAPACPGICERFRGHRPSPARPVARPGPRASPCRRGGEEEINTASSGQRHGGSPFPGAPGEEEPPVRPRALPLRPGALGARQRPGASCRRRGCTGGWAAACAVPAKPRRSRSQSGPAPPRLLLVSPSLLLPSPARPSARTHPPSSCLPGPRSVCAALPLRLPSAAGAAGRVGEWACGKGGEGKRRRRVGREGERRRGRSGGEKPAAALLGRDVWRQPVGRSGGCSDDLYARDGRSPSSGRSDASPATILHWGDLPRTPPPLRVRCRQWAGSGAGGGTGLDGSGRDGAGHDGTCRRRRGRWWWRRSQPQPEPGPLLPGRRSGALCRAGLSPSVNSLQL